MFGLFIGVLFIVLECIFRINEENLINYIKISDCLAIVLLFLIMSLLENKIIKIILVLLSGIFVIQVGHFNYFGYFLFPMEFILFFTKSNEIYETLSTKVDVLVAPIVFSIILLIVINRILKLTKKRLTFSIFKYIFLLILIYPVINTAVHYKKRALGERPNGSKSIIKNSLYVAKTFVGKTLPLYVFDIQVVDKYKERFNYSKDVSNKVDNVILVIGESLSFHYMSLYGYQKSTTPRLDKLSESNNNFYVAKALSSGVFTDTSIPMILNISEKPNAIEHILLNKSNLFKMAKDNKYKTHWVSSQSKDGFSYIRSYMGINYIDRYIDSTDYGFDEFTSGHDDIIYENLINIDLENYNNFIVLNMVGSHSPYSKRVPSEFKPFGDSNDLNHYENTVAYTDKIISDIIGHLKNNSKSKTLLIFTSDHGQSVSENGYGHGNIENKKHYEVPLIFFSNNFKLDKNIQKYTSDNYISHYTMSKIVANYLGYNFDNYLNEDKAYIIGNELSGNAGYVEYFYTENKIEYK